ncbi:DUF3817 domain-containing protein [Brachybacterium sp. JHP9]|uniref:DUF3817 domain-containing protein n=1 Tax=Brachybacterium equifaecis TaxID=2910770 RepID=A0ABT0R2P7_9MICO|nr:DUF3817 domain-containing protein [Brachybacterium equifaecis]MCL6423738.1 DUF3817 domain-containing protein [Brachybacterium equifaecis]
MLSPRRLYRALALAEAVTWTLLIAGMLAKYVLHLGELGVRIGGSVHGFVFLAYCAVTVLVGIDRRWGAGRILLGLVSAVVPYATIPFERWIERQGLLADSWLLREEPARGPIESLAALVLRRPLLSALVILVLVALFFSMLLRLGPPTQWFG